MQRDKFLVSVVGGAVALVAVGAVGTHLLAGAESTSELDRYTSVTVDGHRALAANVVAGRTEGRYHALPWVGKEVSHVSCPRGLKAVAGAMITCTGEGGDGRAVDIPVRVVKADSHSVTWKFER
ncbi:DUF4333 domain-containing protein [Streptomyces lomondensis]|uniref:DUF4333 domain-containing protein n=1 Tax=Streptomyces lomondensis TaxID=68229 RepID=A0ABQ2X360_9ACTN|nr:DUF4333 domain-containing protein [Streptomyces lomondensis]MCF0080058.1 DUF4333 domain-containing protein [Streptomyces lomondensis]GGW96378.1 hypothetical protein GCM10010383_27630 [Streptomyces lomondensis]